MVYKRRRVVYFVSPPNRDCAERFHARCSYIGHPALLSRHEKENSTVPGTRYTRTRCSTRYCCVPDGIRYLGDVVPWHHCGRKNKHRPMFSSDSMRILYFRRGWYILVRMEPLRQRAGALCAGKVQMRPSNQDAHTVRCCTFHRIYALTAEEQTTTSTYRTVCE